jgi:hypothetical protein
VAITEVASKQGPCDEVGYVTADIGPNRNRGFIVDILIAMEVLL